VVITSRNPGWQELVNVVGVDMFDRSESTTLLRRRAPRLTASEADRVAEALGDLPLALTQAAAHLANTATSAQDYLRLLAERTSELLAHNAPTTYPVPLAASVQIALDRLSARSPGALALLSLDAYLAPEPIPLTLFSTHHNESPKPLAAIAGDPLAFTKLTQLLRQYGLALVEPATLKLHRLLGAILRAQPHQHPDLPLLPVRLLRVAVPDDPLDNPPAWPAWRQLLPHVLVTTEARRILTGAEENVAWLLNRAAGYLLDRGELVTARPLFERALDLRRRRLGDDHLETLRSANNLTSTCESWDTRSWPASSRRTPSPIPIGSWATTTPKPPLGLHARHRPAGVRSVPAGPPAAIDQYGQVIDVLVAEQRDLAATRRFLPASWTSALARPR
jgi:Tetratricopeptide repeat